jgi:hypothetical protein
MTRHVRGVRGRSNRAFRPELRIVARDGVASEGELQADMDDAIARVRNQYGAAPSTIEAIMYALRRRGEAGLTESNTRNRLDQCSPEQRQEIIVRLNNLRGRYSAIADGLIIRIAEWQS